MVRIVKANTKHLYEVEVKGGSVEVEANNRDQASRIATKLGYYVSSVNMIG